MTQTAQKRAAQPNLKIRLRKARAQLATSWHSLTARLRQIPALSWIADRLSFVTPVGWGVVAAALLAWFIGLRFNWVEAIAAAVILTILVAVAVVWALGHVSYEVQLDMAEHSVVVGEPGIGKLLVTNSSTRSTSSSRLEMPVGAGYAQFHVPRLTAGEEYEQMFTIPTVRRGVITVGPVSSIRGDSLGIIRKRHDWNDPQDIYIHPRTVHVQADAIGFIKDIEGATTQDLSSSDVSFHALRNYVPGDDRRNVHWKTTARTGRLMVRQFEETRRAHMLLVFDSDASAWRTDEEYELGVSIAASLGGAVLRGQKDLDIYSQKGPLVTLTGKRMLDEFTVIERDEYDMNLPDLTAAAITHESGASVVTLVTGADAPLTSIHRALTYVPVGVVPMVLRAVSGGKLERHDLGGVPIVSVPELESFPAALYKAAR